MSPQSRNGYWIFASHLTITESFSTYPYPTSHCSRQGPAQSLEERSGSQKSSSQSLGIHTSLHGNPHMAAPLLQLPVESRGKTRFRAAKPGSCSELPSGERTCPRCQHREPSRVALQTHFSLSVSVSRGKPELQEQNICTAARKPCE